MSYTRGALEQSQRKERKRKGQGKQEEEENYAKHSPEYDYLEAADAAAAKKKGEAGSSSEDPHFQ